MLADLTNIVDNIVDQVEFYPCFLNNCLRPEFHKVCSNANIVLQAYCFIGASAEKNHCLTMKCYFFLVKHTKKLRNLKL